MKTLFEIGDRKESFGITLCEWGSQYCCIAGFDTDRNKMTWISYKTFENFDDFDLESVLKELGKGNKKVISMAMPEFLLTPISYLSQEVLHDLFSETNSSTVIEDAINEWQVKNQYLIPSTVHTAIVERIPDVSYVHFFTCALKTNNPIAAEDQIAVQFSPNQFSVLVKKNRHLQLAQIYSYQTPLDVVYFLLKIIEELGLSREATHLDITGLIEEKSDLYKELLQYFKHINLVSPTTDAIDDHQYPAHFFTSLYNLATCVS